MNVVDCTGVSKTYSSGVRALGPLDLHIAEGEFLSLLGPSGCGKSTLLRIIAGLDEPTDGAVDVRTTGPRKMGVVFQEPTLMPWATVRQNVGLPLRLGHAPPSQADESVDAMIERVGLAEFADAYPRELSGGMRMRASLARALVSDPDILLMDEPFAALDEITRFQLNDDLLSLWARMRKTIVFVTHSVFESVYLSQRVLVMTPRPGRIASEFKIEAPQPRDASFRTSVAYAEQCRDLSAILTATSKV